MNSVWLLTRLQVMQTIGGVRAAMQKRAGTRATMAGTVALGLVALGVMGWFGWSGYGLVGGLGLHRAFYTVLFLACGAATFVLSLPAVLSSFFGSSDVYDLLPLPVTPLAIVVSKALGVLATSYTWTILVVAAPLLGWGIAAGAGVHYWAACILAVVCAPVAPMAYSGTISIVVASVFKRVRRKDAITTITTVLTLGVSLATYLVANGFGASDDAAQALGGISDALGGAVALFPAYGFAINALAGPDPLGCVLIVLVSLASFAVFVGVARLLYLRIVTSLSAGGAQAKAYDGTVAQGQSSVLATLLRAELHKIVRNSSILVNYVVYPLVVMPALIALGLFSDVSTPLGGSVSELGDPTTIAAGFVMFFVMLFASISSSTNKLSGTCVSREGSNWIHMKFIPVPMVTQLLAKTLPGFFVNVGTALLYTVFGAYLLVFLFGIDALMAVWGCVLMVASAWLMACVGTWMDSRAPNVEWGNDADANVKTLRRNGGMMRVMLTGIAYALLPLIATPLTGLEPRIFMPLIAVAGVAAAVALGRLLLNAAARNMESFE